MEQTKDIFGKRLFEIRESRGESQQELADSIGITRQSLSRYELGERTANIDLLKKVAKHYNISADYLLGLTDNATVDTNLQAVCDYTGLSENAARTFREVILEDSDHKIYGNFKRKDIVSELLESLNFYELIDDLMDIREISDDLTTLLANLSDYEQKNLCQRLGINYQIFDKVLCEGLEDRDYWIDYSEIDVTRYKIYRLIDKISDFFDMRTQIEKYSRDELFDKLSGEIYLNDEIIKQLII